MKPERQEALSEYETAQIENAAREHLAAAEALTRSANALNTSAASLEEVNDFVATDPGLALGRKRVEKMRGAIQAWSVRRMENLKQFEDATQEADEAHQQF